MSEAANWIWGLSRRIRFYTRRLKSHPPVILRLRLLHGQKTARTCRRLRADEKRIRAQAAILQKNHAVPALTAAAVSPRMLFYPRPLVAQR